MDNIESTRLSLDPIVAKHVIIEPIYLTEDQFERLPDFEGF